MKGMHPWSKLAVEFDCEMSSGHFVRMYKFRKKHLKYWMKKMESYSRKTDEEIKSYSKKYR